MSSKGKLILIWAVIVACFVVNLVTCTSVTNNTAIEREEIVKQYKSDIDVKLKRRSDLIPNLVNVVKGYSKHEAETLEKVIGERISKGNVGSVQNMLSAVVEKYPELKADKQYTELMKELTLTENKIESIREAYNVSVKNYNSYIRGFPRRLFLSWAGYEPVSFEHLTFTDAEKEVPKVDFGV